MSQGAGIGGWQEKTQVTYCIDVTACGVFVPSHKIFGRHPIVSVSR